MHQFSIITPTYNRAKYLPRIYDCLCLQDDIDFEWIVIDDESSDNTREIVSGFYKTFCIKYAYQENTGKPGAVNRGVELADSLISTLLDSDDILCPGVLQKVWAYFDVTTGKFEHDCACVSGLCQYDTGEIIGGKFPHDYHISDHIRYSNNKYVDGDKAEFFLTEVLKKYPYPVINNEKHIMDSIIWNRIALTYKTIYVNQIFSEKQFLQGGLSTRNLLLENPHGSELYYNEASVPPFRLKLQIRHSAAYIYYAKINHKNNIYSEALNKAIFPLGLCSYYCKIIKLFLKKYALFQNINSFLKSKRIFALSRKPKEKIFKKE